MMPNISSLIVDEELAKENILNSPKWSEYNVKEMFTGIYKSDLTEIARLMNEKISELKMKIRTFDRITLNRMTSDEFCYAVRDYIQELTIEYDTCGLKKKYDKITKVLEILENAIEYKDDLEIVQEIKKEYIKTKNLNKSSMLYLNKIHRQLTQEKDNGENKTQEFEKIAKAELANLRNALGILTDRKDVKNSL